MNLMHFSGKKFFVNIVSVVLIWRPVIQAPRIIGYVFFDGMCFHRTNTFTYHKHVLTRIIKRVQIILQVNAIVNKISEFLEIFFEN